MAAASNYPDLKNRRVLITGASSGIGLTTARAFLEQGSLVMIHYHSQEAPARELAGLFPGRSFLVAADLSTEDGCRDICRRALEAMGGLDILVHSAGIWNAGNIREITAAVLETMFRTNTFSAFYLAREACRYMTSGNFIYIGSTAGQRGEPYHSHYAASKGAMQSMVYSLAQELAPSIRVNLVSPGWVRTPMSTETFKLKESAIVSAIPLRRVAESEDVAAAILFLASDVSRHLTGVDICCSGGALLPMPRE